MNINIDSYLRLDIIDIITVFISTMILLIIVKKFFWNYATDYFNQRKLLVQNQLDTAANNVKESEEIKAQYQKQIDNAEEEGKQIILDAKEVAKTTSNEIVGTAKDEADKILSKAKKDIELEKEQLKKEIKKEISDVAFMAAEKLVEKELDVNKHKDLVNEFIEQVSEGE